MFKCWSWFLRLFVSYSRTQVETQISYNPTLVVIENCSLKRSLMSRRLLDSIVQNDIRGLHSLHFNHKFNNNALIERDNFLLQLFSSHCSNSLGGFDNSVELRVVSISDFVFGSIVFLIRHARNCLDDLFWVWDFRWFWVCIFQFWGEEISLQQKQLWLPDQDFWYSLLYQRRPPYNSCIAPVWWGLRTVCWISVFWVVMLRWTCLCDWHSQIFCCNREGWHRLWSN